MAADPYDIIAAVARAGGKTYNRPQANIGQIGQIFANAGKSSGYTKTPIQAANTSGMSQPQGFTGGGGGGSPAVSVLDALPKTPEIQALIDKGIINASMTPEQIQAIISISGVQSQVPLDIAALKAQITGDYTNAMQPIQQQGADWMQQIMGANYDPNDPNAALFLQDPMFADYAGGLAQQSETANTNMATDLAWMDKQQQLMNDYYSGLMAAGGSGVSGGGSGGGGGGGGRRGGGGSGGGGGSSSSGDNPFGFTDPKTNITQNEATKTAAMSNLSSNFPGFYNTMIGLQGDNPDFQQWARDFFDINNDPMQAASELSKLQQANQATLDAQEALGASNAAWLDKAPVDFRTQMQQYQNALGIAPGDDPNAEGDQWFHNVGDPNSPINQVYLTTPEGQAQQSLFYRAFDPESLPGGSQGMANTATMLNHLRQIALNRVQQQTNNATPGPVMPTGGIDLKNMQPHPGQYRYIDDPAWQALIAQSQSNTSPSYQMTPTGTPYDANTDPAFATPETVMSGTYVPSLPNDAAASDVFNSAQSYLAGMKPHPDQYQVQNGSMDVPDNHYAVPGPVMPTGGSALKNMQPHPGQYRYIDDPAWQELIAQSQNSDNVPSAPLTEATNLFGFKTPGALSPEAQLIQNLNQQLGMPASVQPPPDTDRSNTLATIANALQNLQAPQPSTRDSILAGSSIRPTDTEMAALTTDWNATKPDDVEQYLTPSTMYDWQAATVVDPQTGEIRPDVLQMMQQQSTAKYRQQAALSNPQNPEQYIAGMGEFYNPGMTPEQISDLQRIQSYMDPVRQAVASMNPYVTLASYRDTLVDTSSQGVTSSQSQHTYSPDLANLVSQLGNLQDVTDAGTLDIVPEAQPMGFRMPTGGGKGYTGGGGARTVTMPQPTYTKQYNPPSAKTVSTQSRNEILKRAASKNLGRRFK